MESKLNVCNNEKSICDIEDQFILRLPIAQADVVRKALRKRSKAKKFEKLLKISLDHNTKDLCNGMVMVKKKKLHAKVVNLPCIIESQKTTDKIHLFKAADISQMLVCKEEEYDSDDNINVNKKSGSKQLNKKYSHPHGIAPPLKNVTKQRFRKVLRCKEDLEEVTKIGKEILYLLREDNEAISTRFEIFYDASQAPPTELSLFGEEISNSEGEDELAL